MSSTIDLDNDVVTAFTIRKEIDIAAPIAIVFDAMLEGIGPAVDKPDGEKMPLVIEPRVGGRWYRDLGNNNGHLWGHVQVIKPPTLLEISGPLMMSYPAVNFVQWRLTAKGDTTHLDFVHRSMGTLMPGHHEGMNKGWSHWMSRISSLAAKKR